jgi:hypothetical protein
MRTRLARRRDGVSVCLFVCRPSAMQTRLGSPLLRAVCQARCPRRCRMCVCSSVCGSERGGGRCGRPRPRCVLRNRKARPAVPHVHVRSCDRPVARVLAAFVRSFVRSPFVRAWALNSRRAASRRWARGGHAVGTRRARGGHAATTQPLHSAARNPQRNNAHRSTIKDAARAHAGTRNAHVAACGGGWLNPVGAYPRQECAG